MSFSAFIFEAVANIVWPWIKSNVWPIIMQKILSEVPILINWFIQKIKDLITEKSQMREQEAKEKAAQAEQKASSAKSQSEVEFYKREAAIWKTVAEQYKNDLADIKSKVSNIEKEMQTEVVTEIAKIDPEVTITPTGANVKISGNTINLPKLPDK